MEMREMNNAICNLLEEYGHNHTSYGVQKILDTWCENKGNLIATLSKHPNWDAENYRIVFSEDYNRGFNRDALREFADWMIKANTKLLRESYIEPTIDGTPATEFLDKFANMQEVMYLLDRVVRKGEEWQDIKVNEIPIATLKEHYEAKKKMLSKFNNEYSNTILADNNEYYIRLEDREKNNKLYDFAHLIKRDVDQNTVTEDFAKKFSEIYPDLNCAVGTRIVKVIRRVCVQYGLDKVKEMRTNRWTDDNGVEHIREMDYGFNKQIAVLGDEINPFKITRHTIISINPLDILTMSFGNGWASCHTIDKENQRGNANTYEGQFCSGTLSYILDEASVIFYTVDADYDGNAFETQDKINRVMFHFNEDFTLMVQGRVYPDGRDGGDSSLAAQFRGVMQKVISDCTGNTNLWVLKKGTSNIREYVRSSGTHYHDYVHYEDCNISLLKENEEGEYKTVKIGHKPICPDCGREHEQEQYLCCYDCQSDYAYHCDRCGAGIPEDDPDHIYCEDNGCNYCCDRCAERDGVHYCDDDHEYHDENNCYQDAYDGRWYHNIEVETEDGHYYGTEDHARNDGYAMTDDGEWYPEDEVLSDDNDGRWFHRDEDTIEINGRYYADYYSAVEAGFFQYEGNWYSEEDMVTDNYTGEMFPNTINGIIEVENEDGDTIYFLNKENAIAQGYLEINGAWVKANEESEVA